MSDKNVFVAGISGMGPALSPLGERIVNARIEARDQLLDDLEKRGLNVDALAHRHHHSPDACCSCGNHTHEANDYAPGDAQERIRALEARVAHLEHQVALRENQVKLLREALAAERENQPLPSQ